ncbi:dTDP-4-dehydrorhamnose reductase [Algibacter luteus]|uniref:dTDP-4-dehydrorhamnose reductase n=1 Tax=Algibacter luteus TaxID=1178825 RepID=UPI002596A3D2|nr:dTDP-4-dehydrorhamnose reductase [Algibacter luteus]WJJ97089.1 dTDP-4-dehydrorhamnose reductase [Algibacter luteus]
MIKKVLVTGANGQLGKTIKELYQINDLGLEFIFVTKQELDIKKKDDIKSFFSKRSFDYCINCAAYTNVEQAEKTPEIAYLINAEGVKYLTQTCEDNNVVLIHISTDYVFDGNKIGSYTIKDLPNPINEYGKSKLLGEQYIQQILKNYFIIRTSWLYSKKYGNNFYRTILKKAKTEKELTITTEQIGCPTNTINLAKYIIDFILNKSIEYGVKHFCDEKVMTWFDFAEEIIKENNLSNKVKLAKAKNYRTFAARPKNSVLL